ncbi:putative inositol polyphosphate phosphatase, catalytic domain homologues [Lyophyllum shimeji]|uniref:Inositol polyphosphate phosphatase, catalytic domain homologues n=1 Tax=Lyophyllum shimeji TaxID=47721 RepID=A0A9P3UIY7_LYOSH|nr:putative inositol polyphosphate phosphatase, catalytic domain homologues [Lyophyllum shimeji]
MSHSQQHDDLIRLLSANTQWAADVKEAEPGFFEQSAEGQAPHTLWIGCADSRVPETVITGARPGDIFVHRNIANQFPLDDTSALAVLKYAVDFLGVQHVVIVGHSECGGAAACFAATQSPSFTEDGPVVTIPSLSPDDALNQWLEPLTRLAGSLHLSTTPKAEALPIVVEENVRRQVENLCKTATLQNAWASTDAKKRNVWVHGWVYDLASGRLRDLKAPPSSSSMSSAMAESLADRVLVQIASYNTNLQAERGLPQDLVDWLSPTLQVSNFLYRERRAPDIVAVGFQELLPLHLGLCGFSEPVIEDRNALILSQIEAHNPNKVQYTLVAKVVNVGVALLVYARDDGIGRTVCDVQTSWTGTGPVYMGNKGAVGVRFRVPSADGGIGETYTFVNAHLCAHQGRLSRRIADYKHIVETLLFAPVSLESKEPSTIYATSHLFVLGDLNFRIDVPPLHPLAFHKNMDYTKAMADEKTRELLKEFDQLLVERRKGTVLQGLHEGAFWKFPCTYKYRLGEVEKYSLKRTPSWTDRVLYATHTDSPDTLDKTNITNVLYTSILGYTTSDHKPIVCILLLPPPTRPTPAPLGIPPRPPMLRLPSNYSPVPDPHAKLKRYLGRTLDRVVGICWYVLVLLGAGSGAVGLFNCIVGLSVWTWWRSRDTGRPPITV